MPPRHSLVWLSDQGWEQARASLAQHQHYRGRLDQWQRAGWPAIARRADMDMPLLHASLGVPLPPDPGDGAKLRIAFHAALADVASMQPPLSLAEVSAAAPQAWRAALAALAGQAKTNALSLRVYGSLAMQALTGLPYVSASSDIDVLFYPATPAQLQLGVGLLDAHCAALPLDGEIVFPGGQAVAWKEWRAARANESVARVLVKQQQSVSLASTASLMATFGQYQCGS